MELVSWLVSAILYGEVIYSKTEMFHCKFPS